jgi:hypothetical protein
MLLLCAVTFASFSLIDLNILWSNVLTPSLNLKGRSGVDQRANPYGPNAYPCIPNALEGTLQNTTADINKFTWQDLVHAVVIQGVPANICPVLDTASTSVADACSALQQQASQADGCVRLEARPSLVVILCMQSGNSEGTLVIQSLAPAAGVATTDNTTPTADGNICHIRVSGPEILQPAVHYCGNVAAAWFRVSSTGTYYLEILQLYEDFSYAAPPIVLADVHAASYKFEARTDLHSRAAATALLHTPQTCHLQAGAHAAVAATGALERSPQGSNPNLASGSHSRSSSAPQAQAISRAATPGTAPTLAGPAKVITSNDGTVSSPDSLPTCRGINHVGHWVVAPDADAATLSGMQPALQRICTDTDAAYGCPHALAPAVMPEVEDHPVLEWLPYNCR